MQKFLSHIFSFLKTAINIALIGILMLQYVPVSSFLSPQQEQGHHAEKKCLKNCCKDKMCDMCMLDDGNGGGMCHLPGKEPAPAIPGQHTLTTCGAFSIDFSGPITLSKVIVPFTVHEILTTQAVSYLPYYSFLTNQPFIDDILHPPQA